MAELFKNIYNKQFFNNFTSTIKEINPNFNSESFITQLFDNLWEKKELKQRMRHTSITLKNHLSEDFNENTNFILQLIKTLQKKETREGGIEYIFFPDFIELYGQENYETSIKAFEEITSFISCEFAVRPFIINYQKEMMNQMLLWSEHKHPMVRRLSSEGCRPRLPWAKAIPSLKNDPSSILPILENLKNDSSESVRKSVANNLNDISKDNPEIVIKLAKKWLGKSNNIDWLIKHGCRTMLKQGISEVLDLFGLSFSNEIILKKFQILTPKIKIGNYLEFAFNFENKSKSKLKIRLEYAIHYQKFNGSLSKKIYKISEKLYDENSITNINRKQSFKIITTRKFYKGLHQVSIIINGKEFEKYNFELVI